MKKSSVLLLALLIISCKTEYHVSVNGDDANNGSSSNPLKTISAAAQLAQPGDVITVHEGIYRERINPPRGGDSDKKRITYQAADGEKVVIKGIRNYYRMGTCSRRCLESRYPQFVFRRLQSLPGHHCR